MILPHILLLSPPQSYLLDRQLLPVLYHTACPVCEVLVARGVDAQAEETTTYLGRVALAGEGAPVSRISGFTNKVERDTAPALQKSERERR